MPRRFLVLALFAFAATFASGATSAARARMASPELTVTDATRGADPAEFHFSAEYQEDVARRTGRTKTFTRVDGRQVAVSRGYRMHYRNGLGQWAPSDPTFRPIGRGYVAGELPFSVVVDDEGLGIGSRDRRKMVLFKTGSRPSVSGSEVRARLAGSPLLWTWTLSEWGLKCESGPVAASLRPRSYDFEYELLGGMRDWSFGEDGNLINADGWRIPPPTIQGADGKSYEGAAWSLLTDPPRVRLSIPLLPIEGAPYTITPP